MGDRDPADFRWAGLRLRVVQVAKRGHTVDEVIESLAAFIDHSEICVHTRFRKLVTNGVAQSVCFVGGEFPTS
jgi:hypothetical protein